MVGVALATSQLKLSYVPLTYSTRDIDMHILAAALGTDILSPRTQSCYQRLQYLSTALGRYGLLETTLCH